MSQNEGRAGHAAKSSQPKVLAAETVHAAEDAIAEADRIVGGLQADELAMGRFAELSFQYANGLEDGGQPELAMRMRSLCDDVCVLLKRLQDERSARRAMQAHRDRLEDILLRRALEESDRRRCGG
jgi:hypothetical protein